MPTQRFFPFRHQLILGFTFILLLGLLPGCSALAPPAPPPEPVFIPAQDTSIPQVTEPAGTVDQTQSSPEELPAPTSTATSVPTPAPLVMGQTPIWVVNNTDHTLLHVHPALSAVDIIIQLEGRLGPVTEGEGAVWVAQVTKTAERNILRIDPATKEVIARIPVRNGTVTSLAAGEGSLWVGISEPAGESSPSPAGGVLRIDPLTNEANVYLPRSAAAAQVMIYDHAVWVLEWNEVFTSIDRIDPVSLQITTLPAVVESSAFVHQFSHIAINPAGIWATSVDAMSKYIYRVDASNGAITSALAAGQSEADNPVTLAASESSVWVATASGKVVQVDAKTGEIAGQVQMKKGITQLFIAADSLWVFNEPEAEIYRINALTRQVDVVLAGGTKPAPTYTPTAKPIPGEAVCQATYPSRLKLGDKAYVNEQPPVPNRVRAEPNVKAEVLGKIDPGKRMEIIEGPLCVDGWVWWKVQADEDHLTGWTAEGDEDEYWLVPLK